MGFDSWLLLGPLRVPVRLSPCAPNRVIKSHACDLLPLSEMSRVVILVAVFPYYLIDRITQELKHLTLKLNPVGVPGRGFCPLGRIGLQYPLLIVKGDKKGQRSEKLYLEAVWKELSRVGWLLNYHNKQTKLNLEAAQSSVFIFL